LEGRKDYPENGGSRFMVNIYESIPDNKTSRVLEDSNLEPHTSIHGVRNLKNTTYVSPP
jgi:hypothetical protein